MKLFPRVGSGQNVLGTAGATGKGDARAQISRELATGFRSYKICEGHIKMGK